MTHFLVYRETQHNSVTHRKILRETQNILRHSESNSVRCEGGEGGEGGGEGRGEGGEGGGEGGELNRLELS